MRGYRIAGARLNEPVIPHSRTTYWIINYTAGHDVRQVFWYARRYELERSIDTNRLS